MSSDNSPFLEHSPTTYPGTNESPAFSNSNINTNTNGAIQARGSDGTSASASASVSAHSSAVVAAAIEKTISCVSCRKRKLKCDRTKPKCATCSRLKHDCEYPERRRNVGVKRRNMKELEARLAEVETRLVSETSKNSLALDGVIPITQSTQPDWNSYPLNANHMNMDMDMGMGFGEDGFMDEFAGAAHDFSTPMNQAPEFECFSQDVIGLGLDEPLPPDQMIDDLHDIYFNKFHSSMPMVHRGRYLAALRNPSHMRPPIALRYAIWTTAASLSDEHLQFEDVFYERTRKYLEQAEMKNHGEAFVTIPHTQAWGLMSTYEAKKTLFTRAWMSTGRMVRLVHMLCLHRIDHSVAQEVKQILHPPKDWIELEERRRTFWACFYCDRWASSGTGWPMGIDENTIMTNLPASEESYELGIRQNTTSFQEALTAEGVSKITSFGGIVLSACLFGHNFEHLHQTGADERPEDLAEGEYWKRHRKMDNVLASTFMFLPDHLRLPGGIRDMNVVFLHMNVHASSICLHQAAVVTAEKHNLSQSVIAQSRSRSLMAAEEISNIMRLISHLDSSNMNTWMGFCLYVASGVFIQDQTTKSPNPQSKENLSFLVAAMKAIGNRHSITQHFTAQVELDISSSGINRYNMVGVYSDAYGGMSNSDRGRVDSETVEHITEIGYTDLSNITPGGTFQPSIGNGLCPFSATTIKDKFNRNAFNDTSEGKTLWRELFGGVLPKKPESVVPPLQLYGVVQSSELGRRSPNVSPPGGPNAVITENHFVHSKIVHSKTTQRSGKSTAHWSSPLGEPMDNGRGFQGLPSHTKGTGGRSQENLELQEGPPRMTPIGNVTYNEFPKFEKVNSKNDSPRAEMPSSLFDEDRDRFFISQTTPSHEMTHTHHETDSTTVISRPSRSHIAVLPEDIDFNNNETYSNHPPPAEAEDQSQPQKHFTWTWQPQMPDNMSAVSQPTQPRHSTGIFAHMSQDWNSENPPG